eukprot:gene4136-biopygen23367
MARAWRGLWAIFGLGGAGVARACPVTPGCCCRMVLYVPAHVKLLVCSRPWLVEWYSAAVPPRWEPSPGNPKHPSAR